MTMPDIWILAALITKFALYLGVLTSAGTVLAALVFRLKNYRSSEGREVVVPYRGAVAETIQNILGGVRSTCTYAGASRLKHLMRCATFIRCYDTHNRVYENN